MKRMIAPIAGTTILVLTLVVTSRAEEYLNHSGSWTLGNWSSLPTSGTDWAKIGQNYLDGDGAPTVSIGPGDTVSGGQNLAVGRDLGGNITATINMSGGTLSGGTMYVGDNNNAAGVVNQTGGAVTMSGNIDIGHGGCVGTYNLSNGGTVSAASLLVGNGGSGTLTLAADAGSATASGNLYVGNGSGTGSLIQHGGIITVQGGEFQVSLGGQGTYTMDGGVLYASVPTTYIGNGAAGTFTQSGGTTKFSRIILGYSVASQYTLSGGQMNVVTFDNWNSSTFTFNGGTLSADTVNFNLTNAGGTVAPGRTNSIGKTLIGGLYSVSSASAALAIQLGGTGQGTTYDWLSASGTVSLNGNLTVSLANGFTPAGMDAFTVVTGSSVSGAFANAPVSGQRYNLGGGSFIVTYNANSVVLSVNAIIPAASMTASGAGGNGPASYVIDGNASTYSYGGNPVTLVLDGLYSLTGYTYLDRPNKAWGDPLTYNVDFIYDAYAPGGSTGYIPNTSVPNPQSGTLTGLAGMVLVKGDGYGGGAEVTLGGAKVANLLPAPSVVYGSSGNPYNASYDWAYALDKNIDTESAAGGGANAYVVLDFGSAKSITYIDFIDRESPNGGTWEFSDSATFSTILATTNYSNGGLLDSNVGDGFRPHVLDLSSLHVSARYVRWTAISGGNAGLREVTFYEAASPGGNAVDNDGGETDVQTTSAKIRGTLLSEAASPTTCKFYWWQSGSATTNIVDMGTRSVGETFTNQLLGLSQNTTYYYKTYCTNSAGEQFSTLTESFTTYGMPAVENLPPTGVDSTAANVRGQLTGLNNGDAAIYWGLTDGGTNAANWGHTNSFPSQVPNVSFSVGLSGLTAFTNYYYRCFATNAYGEAWAASTTNFFTQSATHDWRWSTPGGGYYNTGTNYNGGSSVYLPPTAADQVSIGISTYPAAQHDNTITINGAAHAKGLALGYDGTNNTLIVQSGGLTTAGQFDLGTGGNTFQQTGGDSVLTGGDTYLGNGGPGGASSQFLLDGGTVKTLGQTLSVGWAGGAYLRLASGTTLDLSSSGTQSGGGGWLWVGRNGQVGTVDIQSGATVYVGAGAVVGTGGSGNCTVNQAANTLVTINGNLQPAWGGSGTNAWIQNGGATVANGNLRICDNGGITGGYTLNGGSLTVNGTGDNNYIAIGGPGTFNQNGGTATFANPLFLSWSVGGTYNLAGGTLNTPMLTKSAGGYTFNFTGGTASVDTVNIDLTNAGGTLAPGRTNSTGKTQVNGTYTVNSPSAKLAIQLGGTGPGTTYDWLSASGAVTLNGNLTVSLVNGFTPATGNTFTVVTGDSVSGTFANAPVSGSRYNLGAANFIVTYNTGSVVLSEYSELRPSGTSFAIR